VAKMLCEVVSRESPGSRCDVVLDEIEAFAEALGGMQRSEVVVMFYDKLKPVLDVLQQHNAVPVTSLEEVAQPEFEPVTA